jgi:C1A family cysteine protease
VNFKFNYKFEPVDSRDYKYTPKLFQGVKSSSVFSLKITRIYDQSYLGSCVSNAVAGCINYYNDKMNPSRLYIYFNGRLISGLDAYSDTGLTVRDGCKSVAKYSCCQESLWSYNINSFTSIPSLYCYNNTIKFTNFTYKAVNQDLTSIKNTLIGNNPVLFGFIVYSSFLNNNVTTTGIVPMPNTQTETLLGGHCVYICGYDDNKRLFKCVNSWGTGWGDKGFFYMPYDYVLNPGLSSDFWIINFTNKTSKSIAIPKSILMKIKI